MQDAGEAGDRGARLDALIEAFMACHRAGEAPDLDTYARAHPGFADELHQMVPAVLLMADLSGESTWEATLAPTRDEIPVPLSVADYEILRELGRGGMGVVYEGRHADGNRAAVKCLRPALAADERYVARFLREARLGLDLVHPNLVRTLAVGTWRDRASREVPYLALEYLEGCSLRQRQAQAREGRLDEAVLRAVGRDVCQALAAIHEKGLVHRDVKPGNIFVLEEGRGVLLDLGVARPVAEARGLTRTGEFVGSFAYAAPEQFKDDPSLLGSWTDLYALGLTLYELGTGRNALDCRDPTVDDAEAAHLSPEFRLLLRELRGKDPALRPRDAARRLAR